MSKEIFWILIRYFDLARERNIMMIVHIFTQQKKQNTFTIKIFIKEYKLQKHMLLQQNQEQIPLINTLYFITTTEI